MLLITRHMQVLLLLNCLVFLCVGFIKFGSVSFEWKSKATTNPVILCQLSYSKLYIQTFKPAF